MTWILAGLGNPGDEYEGTRHNTGRMALDFFSKKEKFGEWKDDKKAKARINRGVIGKNLAVLVEPDTFMNKSGAAISKFVKSMKAAEKLIVLYDDLDLPLGRFKLSFDRGSGGHKGVESITRAVKTKKFVRVRIGVSPSTDSGKLRKPEGEKDVVKFILGRFKPHEHEELNSVFKKIAEAIESVVLEGREIAMNKFN